MYQPLFFTQSPIFTAGGICINSTGLLIGWITHNPLDFCEQNTMRMPKMIEGINTNARK